MRRTIFVMLVVLNVLLFATIMTAEFVQAAVWGSNCCDVNCQNGSCGCNASPCSCTCDTNGNPSCRCGGSSGDGDKAT